MHSACCTRVLLNIRKAAAVHSSEMDFDTFARHTTLMFETAPGPDDPAWEYDLDVAKGYIRGVDEWHTGSDLDSSVHCVVSDMLWL